MGTRYPVVTQMHKPESPRNTGLFLAHVSPVPIGRCFLVLELFHQTGTLRSPWQESRPSPKLDFKGRVGGLVPFPPYLIGPNQSWANLTTAAPPYVWGLSPVPQRMPNPWIVLNPTYVIFPIHIHL